MLPGPKDNLGPDLSVPKKAVIDDLKIHSL